MLSTSSLLNSINTTFALTSLSLILGQCESFKLAQLTNQMNFTGVNFTRNKTISFLPLKMNQFILKKLDQN